MSIRISLITLLSLTAVTGCDGHNNRQGHRHSLERDFWDQTRYETTEVPNAGTAPLGQTS